MGIEEIKGDLETYKLWLIGEDYEPEPKITLELIDSILKVLESVPNLEKLLEQAREEAEKYAIEEYGDWEHNGSIERAYSNGAQFILTKLNERKSE